MQNTLKDSQRAETCMFLPFSYAIKILFVLPCPIALAHPSAPSSPSGISAKGALPLWKPQRFPCEFSKKSLPCVRGGGIFAENDGGVVVMQNSFSTVLSSRPPTGSLFYNKFFLNSSPERGLRYAGGISNTVLQPD